MSFWKRLFGVVEGPPVHRPILATPQPTLPDQDKRDDIKASAGVCSEATAIFVWKADVMPTSYGRVAQEALSSAFRIALRPNPAEVLGLEARAGDVLGPNPIGASLRSFLMSVNAETANVDAEIRASIQTGKVVDYVPYVLVINVESDGIQLAHQELLGKQVVGYLGVISINPPIALSRVGGQLSLPLASLQISSGRPELSDPELIQLLAQAEKESDKAKTVALCDQILANNPDSSDGHNLRGWALKELNRIDEAESAYRRAIEIDPKHAAALWNLSYIVGSERRDYRSAVLLIDRAIALKPPFLSRAISERARYASLADEAEQLCQHDGQNLTSTTATDSEICDTVESGDLEKVRALVKANPELVFRKLRSSLSVVIGPETLLSVATRSGHTDVVLLLLDNKADINAKSHNEWTPLHRAENKEVAEILLANGAEVNVKTTDGKTPLHLAAGNGHDDVAELLLAHKAEVNARTNEGDTPLHFAAGVGHKKIVELLLANQAEVDAKDNGSKTPLHWAARKGQKSVAELLLANGADVNVKTVHKGKDEWTPLHMAAFEGHKDVVEVLLAHKAEVDAKDNYSNTPLHVAASNGHIDVAKLLLAHNAEVNAKDKGGATPLHKAEMGRKAVAELLRQCGGHE